MEEYIVRVYDYITEWFNKANQLHRLNGPARDYKSGSKVWYKNGEKHRLDGPAVDVLHRRKQWYIEGKEYTEREFLEKTQPATELTVAEIAKRLGINNLKIVKG